LALSLSAHRHGILIAFGDHLRVTLWTCSTARAEDRFAIEPRCKGRGEFALIQLPLRQRAQRKIPSGGDPRARVT
jgi:hypothetical protein